MEYIKKYLKLKNTYLELIIFEYMGFPRVNDIFCKWDVFGRCKDVVKIVRVKKNQVFFVWIQNIGFGKYHYWGKMEHCESVKYENCEFIIDERRNSI